MLEGREKSCLGASSKIKQNLSPPLLFLCPAGSYLPLTHPPQSLRLTPGVTVEVAGTSPSHVPFGTCTVFISACSSWFCSYSLVCVTSNIQHPHARCLYSSPAPSTFFFSIHSYPLLLGQSSIDIWWQPVHRRMLSRSPGARLLGARSTPAASHTPGCGHQKCLSELLPNIPWGHDRPPTSAPRQESHHGALEPRCCGLYSLRFSKAALYLFISCSKRMQQHFTGTISRSFLRYF